MIRQEIKKIINQAVAAANLNNPEFEINHPDNRAYGDYSANVALSAAKIIKMPPLKIAENLRPRILRLGAGLFEKVEIAEPGFINFFISKEYLQGQVREILEAKENFGRLWVGNTQKINIE